MECHILESVSLRKGKNLMNAKEFYNEFSESTIKVIILGAVTYGVYYFIWIAERRRKMNELAGYEIFNYKLLVAAAICSGLSSFITLTTGFISDPFQWNYGILIILIIWKIGAWFESYCANEYNIDIKMNKFFLFVGNIFYLNYLINKLNSVENTLVSKSSRHNGQIVTSTTMAKYPEMSEKHQFNTIECPTCAETIKRNAKICRFCGYALKTEKHVIKMSSTSKKNKQNLKSQLPQEMEKGMKCFKENKYQEAVICFTKCINKDNKKSDALFARGVSLYNLGKVKEAINDFESAAKLGYKKATTYLNKIKST
jgi:hypothetical protein